MRRFTAALIAVLLLFSVSTAYGVEMNLIYDEVYHYYNVEDIHLQINGKAVATKEMPPVILMDRTMVPVREVFEAMGCRVTWLDETRQTKISYDDSSLLFTTGSRTISYGNTKTTISKDEPAPMIINDKTMVPVRILADLLGFDVRWDENTRTVILNEPGFEDNGGEASSSSDSTFAEDGEISRIFCTAEAGSDLVYLAYGAPKTPAIYRYDTPERVVLDFPDTSLAADVPAAVDFADGAVITAVRSANHDGSARIVLDVKAQPNIEIHKSATGIVIAAGAAGAKYTTKVGDLVNGAVYEPPEITAGSSSSSSSGEAGNEENSAGNPVTTPTGPDGITSIIPVKPVDGSVNLDVSGTVDTTNSNSFDYASVVIDAGHGGSDPGAISENVREKDINLSISLKVRDKLEAAGYSVVMTRTGDTYPTLQDRVDIASRTVNGKIPAIFVSIHCNSFENTASNGTQVYYHPDSRYGTILAQNIYNANVSYTSLKAGQIHDGSHLFVIRKTIQPAALVETAFLSNASDRAYLSGEAGQEALAQGIYEGIVKTMEQMKRDKGIE